MPQNKRSEHGNVFLIILIAVVLFGALIFTLSKSGSQGISSISKQEAKIAAQEILNYARLVEGAVDRVRRNGCSENEISFENAVVAGYSNPNAPPDKTCHVFEPEGGKISFLNPKEEWLDNTKSTEPSYNEIYYVAENEVRNLNGNRDDLLLQINWLNLSICESINDLLYNTTTIEEDPANFFYDSAIRKAIGTFDQNAGNINLSANATFDGKNSACFSSENYGGYHFYHALLAR